MPHIHVIFPKEGDTIVRHAAEVAPRLEPITWCFHSANDDVKAVEVKFQDEWATFFEKPGNSAEKRTWFQKELDRGGTDFYGHVPDYGPLTSPKVAKYTVRGLKALGGGTVDGTEVDPVVVTPKP